MTDISNWPELVHCARVRWRGPLNNDDSYGQIFSDYIMVPLNAYQMGNLIDALTQAKDTGDWYFELVSIIVVAMKKAGIEELSSNRGNKFKLDDLVSGRWRQSAAHQSEGSHE